MTSPTRRSELPAQRPGRVKRGEVIAPKFLVFEERDRERIAQGERHGRAGGGSQRFRAGFLGHARIEHDIGMAREHGVESHR